MSDPPWLDDLNAEQRRAVTHDGGPLLVVAGAGSGKTRTLAYRVSWLVYKGVPAQRILLLTFTRRAAQEMLQRAEELLRRSDALTQRVWGGTFHATANRLLRIYAHRAQLPREFTVLDEADAEDLLQVLRHNLQLSCADRRFPRKATCRAIYSLCVNSHQELSAVLQRHFPWCIEWEQEFRNLFHAYTVWKQEHNLLDYDDLLLYWLQLLHDEKVAAAIEGRFDHILVDEYQDTNPVQAAILRGMRRTNANLMVVGDDAQSIYSFRAATIRNMRDFPRHFPGTTVVTLETNYRSVSPILKTTNCFIRHARDLFTKELRSARGSGARPKLVTCRDEDQQNQYVVERILAHYEEGIPLRRQAVLFRIGYLSDSLEIELTRRRIPFRKYGGLRFLEAAHVKDLVAFLRILENPCDDLAWFRVLQLLDGVGPSTATAAVRHVRMHHNDPRSVRSFRAPKAACRQIAELADVFDDCIGCPPRSPSVDIERIRRFYDPLLRKNYPNVEARTRDLESLEQVASGYRSRTRFLMDLQLDPPTSTSDLAGTPCKDDDWLTLSTIHSAKGCEWDVVFLIHASDGCLPSDLAAGSEEELDEERRLAYVAMTRARDFLYVTWPLRYYHRRRGLSDRHSYAQLSRFLTRDVCATMDAVWLAQEGPSDTEFEPDRVQHTNIHERLRRRWE